MTVKYLQCVDITYIINRAIILNGGFTDMRYSPEDLVIQAIAFTLEPDKLFPLHPSEYNTHKQILGTLSFLLISLIDEMYGQVMDPPKITNVRLIGPVLTFDVEFSGEEYKYP